MKVNEISRMFSKHSGHGKYYVQFFYQKASGNKHHLQHMGVVHVRNIG